MSAADIALVADGAMVLRVDPQLRAVVDPWIPRHRAAASAAKLDGASLASPTAVLSVRLMTIDESCVINNDNDSDDDAPTLTLGGIRGYVEGDDVKLRGQSGLRGCVRLAQLSADVSFGVDVSPIEMHGSLTLASALLLGRLGRALMHAAAVVDPGGRGWLLVGDSHSGKTTTCASLMAVGWTYVADDQVVLSEASGQLLVEGWPRDAHLDSGWSDGHITRNRLPVDLTAMRRDVWTSRMMIHGICFPNVVADQRTTLVPIASADALGRLVRQTPWLLADATTAAATLAMLGRAASTTCGELSLGRDSFANGELLVRQFESMSTAR